MSCVQPVIAQAGPRTRANLRVIRVERETAEAVSLYLEPEDTQAAFGFNPGQYLSLQLDIDGQSHVRCYSLSDSPRPGVLRVTVKQVCSGRVSTYLNQQARPGMRLIASPPQGDFGLRNSERAFLAVAAGSGITPLLSMLKHMLQHSSQPCRLLYLSPTPAQTIFLEELRQLGSEHPGRLRVQNWYSRQQGSWQMEQAGQLLETLADGLNPDVYLCGPPAWMEQVRRYVAGRPECFHACHSESFVGQSPEVPATTQEVHEVLLHLDGQTHRLLADNNQSILSSARAAGLDLPSGCEMGKCGACMAQKMAGELETGTTDCLTSGEIAQGYLLCCQARPLSSCELVIER